MIRYSFVLFVSMVLFCSVCGFLWAQESEDTLDLGKIVVTPTSYPLSIRDSSFSISVITKSDIEASTSHSATDILTILPGVFVQKTGQFGRADVVIRGQGSRGRRIMVLVDGKPEKMGLYGCTITHALPLDNVQRIEVVRGPASVLYGSDAIGGVINIITEKPKEKFEGQATALYGSYDTQEYLLKQGGKFDTFDYFFTYDREQSRGHLPNSDYNSKNATLRLGQQLNEQFRLGFSTRYFDGFKREPSPAPADTWNLYKRGAYDLTLDGKITETSNLMLKTYRDFGMHKFSDGTHSKDYTNGAMLHFDFELLKNNTLLLGSEFRQQGGKILGGSGTVKGNYKKDEFAFFFHDEQRLFDKLILSGGLRYNDDEYIGGLFAGQAGVVYHLLDTTSVRMSANKGFRAPGLNELRFATQANPDLKAEEAWNYEAGFNHQLTKKLNIDFAFFYMDAKNFIRISSAKFRNIDTVKFKGTETSLEYIFNELLRARLSYSWLDTGIYTQGRPENELDMSLIYNKKKWKVSLTGQWVGDYYAADSWQQKIPDFFLLNSKVMYGITADWQVFLGINNILNVGQKIYADVPGASGVFTQPKRNFETGVTFKW